MASARPSNATDRVAGPACPARRLKLRHESRNLRRVEEGPDLRGVGEPWYVGRGHRGVIPLAQAPGNANCAGAVLCDEDLTLHGASDGTFRSVAGRHGEYVERETVSPVGFLETGVLHRGDSLEVLPQFPAECVDMCYLDPPFFGNRVWEVVFGDEAEVRSFESRTEGGIQHYVGWIESRLRHIHRILKRTGSLYLHCDPASSHYLKVMLDDVFGAQNFRNEIIWKRTSAHSSARRYGPVHDTILFYTKTESYVWNQNYQPLPQETIDQWYNNVDPETGRRFNRADLTASGIRTGPSGAPWRGIDPSAKGRHWAIPGFVAEIVAGKDTLEALDALDEARRIFWPRKAGGMPMVKRYLEESRGVPAQDVITHISPLKNVTTERIGWPTQKPEALLELFIQSSTKQGQIVLDPFCGCGTTVAVAHKLQRQWIGIDVSPLAVQIMKERVEKVGAVPTVYGLKRTIDELRREDPLRFQEWVIWRIGGIRQSRQTGDLGIDGYSFFDRYPIQIKRSDGVGRKVVDEFEAAVEREGKRKGYIVAFSFTSGAVEEAARVKRQRGLEIVLVKVADVVRWGELIDVAAEDGRPPSTQGAVPDLIGLFKVLQAVAEGRAIPDSTAIPLKSKRKRRPAQQQFPFDRTARTKPRAG